MKIGILIYLVMTIGFLVSCQKDGIVSKQYQNANIINIIDTTIGFSSIPLSFEIVNYDLDIDLDGVVDLSFNVSINPGYNDFIRTISIKTLNNYEFAFQKAHEIREGNFNDNNELIVDSVLVEIPKILETQDTISKFLSFESDLTKLAYKYSWKYNSYNGDNYISGFSDIGIKYIGIRNETSDIFCWIKIEVNGYKTIRIISFYYSIGKNFLVIEE